MVDITDVNTDETVATSSTGNIATGTDLQDVNLATITDSNGNTINAPVNTPSATQFLFDLGDMIAGNIKFGVASLFAEAILADFRITQLGDSRVTESGDMRITN